MWLSWGTVKFVTSPGTIGILWKFCVYFVTRSYSDWKKLTESKKNRVCLLKMTLWRHNNVIKFNALDFLGRPRVKGHNYKITIAID